VLPPAYRQSRTWNERRRAFGSNPLTGSIGVITINMPRIAYQAKSKKDFFQRLERLMELAKESLETKRKVLEKMFLQGYIGK